MCAPVWSAFSTFVNVEIVTAELCHKFLQCHSTQFAPEMGLCVKWLLTLGNINKSRIQTVSPKNCFMHEAKEIGDVCTQATQKGAAVAYKGWSPSRGSNCSDLTENILVFWKSGC